MKLSEYKNEEALDILAEIIEPATNIIGDAEVKRIYKEESQGALVKYIIKTYKSDIITILAVLDGVPRDEYECNIFTLPAKLMELMNDKELISFFSSSAQSE